MKVRTIYPKPPACPCPTCGHLHIGGQGLGFCMCQDCLLLSGSVPRDLLSKKNLKRLDRLERLLKEPRP